MELSFADERRFVWARLSGTWAVDGAIAKLDLMVAECVARKQDLLLVDFTPFGPQTLTTLDRYRLGASVVSFSKKLRKIAAASAPELIDPEKLGERVARNRGVNVRIFGSLDEAQRWLLDDPPPAAPS